MLRDNFLVFKVLGFISPRTTSFPTSFIRDPVPSTGQALCPRNLTLSNRKNHFFYTHWSTGQSHSTFYSKDKPLDNNFERSESSGFIDVKIYLVYKAHTHWTTPARVFKGPLPLTNIKRRCPPWLI
jgi:hypothetical protein